VTEAKPPAPRSQNVIPMLRRIGEAVKMIFGLVESVEQLRAKNDILTAKVDELRRELDLQAGQVRVLMQFVQSALDDRVEMRATAAARAVLVDHESKSGAKSPGRNRRARRNESANAVFAQFAGATACLI
jgi:hypothetical protein